jgi:Flp pilus assembly protein TadD
MRRARPTSPPRPGTRPAAPSARARIPLLFLGLSLLLYGSTLRSGFVHDDKPLIQNNRLVREGDWSRIFASGYWTTGGASVPELYRPLTVASFAMHHRLAGASPFWYHLGNVLLHGWVCYLVYRLALLLGGAPAAAFGAGVVFAVHPVHVEAVAPAVGRSDLLAAALVLAAWVADRRALEPGSRRVAWTIAAGAAALGAFFSKENALVFPFAVILTDTLFPSAAARAGGWARRLADHAAYFGAAGVYLAARLHVLGSVVGSSISPMDNPIVAMDRVTALRTAVGLWVDVVRQLVAPIRLAADYSFNQIPPVASWADPKLATAVLLALCALLLAVWGYGRARAVTWGVCFVALAWLPVSHLLFPVGTIFAERLLYLPSAGLCLLAGLGFAAGWRKAPRVCVAVLGILALLGSMRILTRNGIWRDDASFAFATAADAPRSAKAAQNLGILLEDRGSPERAAESYARAVAIAPDWADARYNLAGALLKLGRVEEAIPEYRRAVELRPGDLRFRLNLGYAMHRSGRYEEAVETYRRILAERGDQPAVLNNLGASLVALGRLEEGVAAYRGAASRDPANPEYRVNLGRALLEAGEGAEAAREIRRAIELGSGDPAVRYHLARALERAGDLDGAERVYREVLARSPAAGPALRNLGMLLARKGQPREAADLLRRAEELIPGGLDPEARKVLSGL